jgi:membrane-associated phospholipid phosphatase
VLAELLKSIDMGAYYSFTEMTGESAFLAQMFTIGDWLGSYIGIGVAAMLAVGFLVLQQRLWAATLTVASIALAILAAESMRRILPAHRPANAVRLVATEEMVRSFPSREVLTFTLAASWLLFAGWMYLRRAAARAALLAVITVLILWVAMSQLMLGVHFVTDVAAGLFAGIALALLASRLFVQPTVATMSRGVSH